MIRRNQFRAAALGLTAAAVMLAGCENMTETHDQQRNSARGRLAKCKIRKDGDGGDGAAQLDRRGLLRSL